MFARKGPSEYQVPHSFSLPLRLQLPFSKGKARAGSANRLANGVIGGWQLEESCCSAAACRTPSLWRAMWQTRASAVSGPAESGPASRTARCWHPGSIHGFRGSTNFTYGNSGLRILSPDILRTVDFSLFAVPDRRALTGLQLRWEAFNLPEHAQLRGSLVRRWIRPPWGGSPVPLPRRGKCR
jgi:hypothetical protein